MDCINCCICGESIESQLSCKLACNHEFHYNCLALTFKNMKTNACPLCREGWNKLPLVNGLKKINPIIHDISDIDNFENVKCQHILTRGKRKGEKCSNNCILGKEYCGKHLKSIKE